MTQAVDLDQVTVELRQLIDDMSTNLMMHGVESVHAEDIDRIAVDAEQGHRAEAARVARGLASRIRSASLNSGILLSVLGDALSEIKLALDQDESAHHDSPPEKSPSSSMAFAEDPELISDFLVEAREHLASIESHMLELERNPRDMEVLHSVFRTFHTIKGLAGFLEFDMIQAVAHEVETLLDLARKEELIVASPVVDVVLEAADYLKQELNRVEANLSGTTAGKPAQNCALIHKIELLATAGRKVSSQSAACAEIATTSPIPSTAVIVEASEQQAAVPTIAPSLNVGTPSVEAAKTQDAFSVRVETAKLDHLLDMVGEMVIAQALVKNNPVLASSVDTRLLADIAQLSRNTAEVQRTTMSMRMVPVGQLFQRTARLIRDLSRKAGKKITLETAGEDTEVDKTIAEELADPLLHMVRNSIDHGIEEPQERIEAGKNPEARIRLTAYHQAGQIIIGVSDDGRGLNKGKILAKAIQNGMIPAGSQLSDAETFHLIFEPGFSTAEKVTDVSGRGVGMDVVRRNVQKLRGRIDTQSVEGQGTTFLLKLPLTLAIIDGLVVIVGDFRYVVPIFAVREIFRPTAEVLSTVQGRHDMALVRGSLLPIVRLHSRFGIPPTAFDPKEGLLVVAECDGKQFCLLVDDLIGKQEVVIKSLGETFKDISGLAGCAVLGDGRVGLILDMDGIYRGGAR